MKIAKLHIKNHRILDDVVFDFTDSNGKALDTVVLAGVNGCGKTTVLELIKSLILRPVKANAAIGMEVVDFEDRSFTAQALVSFDIKMGDVAEHKRFLQRLQHQENIQVAYLPVKLSRVPLSLPFFKLLGLSSHKYDMKSMALKEVRDDIFRHRDQAPQATIERQIQKITKAMQTMNLHTRLVDLESEELVFESANGKRIYFEDLSNGEQRLYFQAIYLSRLHINNGIIMIDEPETALHPTWQQNIAQLYRNIGENNQVFMATHSPHIMASVPPECLFILHIDEESKKVSVVNAAKANLHTQGLEPNRILKEVMEVETLRDWETQRDIELLTKMLNVEQFENINTEKLAEKLTQQLGRQDPFIMRLEHQMLMLRRKKENLSAQKT